MGIMINGQEKGNYYIKGLSWGYFGIMEKKVETKGMLSLLQGLWEQGLWELLTSCLWAFHCLQIPLYGSFPKDRDPDIDTDIL